MDWDTPPGAKETENNSDIVNPESLLRKGANKGLIIFTVISVILLMSTFLIRPALIGYSVYKQAVRRR